ncbi:50S ribosomal protein L2 [Patescibacteria group bacterium]
MALKIYKPTTPARRKMSVVDFKELTKKSPEKKLITPNPSKAGRNQKGRITVRRRGGGHKKHYRIVDFGRSFFGVPAKVIALEYDPNRSTHIALIRYQNGSEIYIIAPKDLKVGNEIVAGKKTKIAIGNRLQLKYISIGTGVYNVELSSGSKGQIARSAGTFATVLAKEGDRVHLKLPSSEVRIFDGSCFATIGQVSNIDHENVRLGKAGRARHMGRRPKVRGKAMNPCDHPHGGGEGSSPIGLKHPKTPTGKPALGYRTRKKRKFSNRYIVKRRTGEKVG